MIFENVNIIDLFSILIILLSILASTWRGVIREIMTILILVLSFFISNLIFDYALNLMNRPFFLTIKSHFHHK